MSPELGKVERNSAVNIVAVAYHLSLITSIHTLTYRLTIHIFKRPLKIVSTFFALLFLVQSLVKTILIHFGGKNQLRMFHHIQSWSSEIHAISEHAILGGDLNFTHL